MRRQGLMGYYLVRAAFDHWWHLPDRPLRILAYMANVADDRHMPPRYWNGWEPLAVYGCGRKDWPANPGHPAPCRCDVCSYRRSGLEIVRRGVNVLLDSKVIEQLSKGGSGRRTEYSLAPIAQIFQRSVGAISNDPLGLSPNDPLEIAPTIRRGLEQGRTREEYPRSKSGFSSEPHQADPQPVENPKFDLCAHGQPGTYLGSGNTRLPTCGECRRNQKEATA